MPFADATVVVAVSGGADSLSLLLALDDLRERKKLDLRLVAAHFNHRLRGRESDADEAFVKHIAAERKFELALGHGPIEQDGNLEQNARNARYAFLTETAVGLKAGCVLTAHTINDQAETFLLNLIRGSGVDGLSAMRPIRELPGEEEFLREGEKRRKGGEENLVSESPLLPFSPSLLLVRPLLRWAKREDTENFCRESGVQFRYDTMNEDMSFKRVRVRKMLIPMLREFNPRIVETLAQTAELMRSVSVTDEKNSQNSQITPDELLIKEIEPLDPAALQETLRSWLKTRRGDLRSISFKHIEAVRQLVQSRKSGRIVELPGFGVVWKENGRLRFEEGRSD